MQSEIQHISADGIVTLVIDRASKKNALAQRHYQVLADALESADADPAVRAIIIRSEGDTFCAGNDMRDFVVMAEHDGDFSYVLRFIRALATLRTPLIAAVQGAGIGIGMTMLLHCDHVLLAPDARLYAPFARLGLVPEAGSSLLLTERIGHVRAFSTFVSGAPILAEEAVSWGIANAIVERSELEAAAYAFAQSLCALSPTAVAATTALMRPVDQLSARIDAEMERFALCLTTPEAREAFRSFMDRR